MTEDAQFAEYRRIDREAKTLIETVRRAELYRVAAGMPARNQASKLDLARWLLTYAPDRIADLKVNRA